MNPAIQAELKRNSVGTKAKTRVYHIAYAPDIKKAYLFFWGCNLKCRGCLCKKEINCLALEDNLDVVFRDPGLALPQTPARLLSVDEVMDILGKVEVEEVLFEGQEASIDPLLPRLCAALKQEFGCRITLNTNGVKLPDVKDIDEVVLSLKAITPGLYKDYTERSNKSVLKNFLKLYHSDVLLRTETVFIPGYIDLEETEKIARCVAGVDSSIPLRIDAYFVSGDNPWRRALPEEMTAAVEVARRHLVNVTFTQQEKPGLKKEDLMFEVVRLY